MTLLPDALSDAARALLARRAGLHPDAGPRNGAAAESVPLATPQLGQWLSSQVSRSDLVGALPKLLHLEGPLDREALRRALTEIVRRHQVLRAVFSITNGEPVQQVTPPREVELPEVDLRSLSADQRPAAAQALLDQDARRPFDLRKDLLLRALLVQLDDQAFEFQVTFQHVAFDGWSNGVYLRELGALYSAYADGRPSPLAEPTLQYADFAVWERRRETTPAFEADRAYWKEQVAGSSAALGLLTDRARTRHRSLARASVTAMIEAPLTLGMSRIALEERTTLFAVAFAAFQVLVGRRAGCEDFVLGVVSANRTRRETEDLIGSFITVIPFRTRLDEAPSFRMLVRRTADSLARGFAHQSFPCQRLVLELRPGGDPGFDPLYDVLFNYRNMPVSLPAMHRLTVSDFRAPHLGTTYDLHLNVTPEGGGLRLELEYNPDLFHEATAARWLEGYRAVLETVVEDPEASCARVPVMPARERRLLLEEWSGSSVPRPAGDSILDRFETGAAASPDSPAVEHDGVVVSYRELAIRIDRLAGHLQRAGAVPGDLIGVASQRSADAVAAALAIFSIGAVYVPLDGRTPARRLDAMLAATGLKLILTDRAAASDLAGRSETRHCIPDLLAADSDGFSGTRPRLEPNAPAYVIFTSGSTGAPKGVIIPHGALARYTASAADIQDVRAGDRMLHFADLTFDASIKEIFAPLGIGATVVVRPGSIADSPSIFAAQCRALRLTHVSLPTAFWNEIVTAEWPEGMDLGAVRLVAIGGQVVSPDLARRFFVLAQPGIRLFNGYGPTETTVAASWAELFRGEEYPGEAPIGQPYQGVTLRVVDRRGQPVPIGTPGELWIGGGNVALGYLGAPELTAERFVHDPESPQTGERFYRSGDRARWRGDGKLGFLGRLDLQIKLRGYRIEPGDIERALCGAPGVRQAVVMLHPATPDRLVAFVVPEKESIDPEAIRAAAALELPQYMVPADIVPVKRLPLGSTGKVDRPALAAMVPTGAGSTREIHFTPTERVVARIWKDVLGVAVVGPDDRFLDLGGSSLLALRMANRLRAELGVELTIRTLLTYPTVTTLARELDGMRRPVAPSRG